MDFKIPDRDDLTMDEIHDWYKNIIKRFGWIAVSTKNGIEKDNYKKEINEVIGKAIKKKAIVNDLDKINDLDIIIRKLKDTSDIVDLIKKNYNDKRTYRKSLNR